MSARSRLYTTATDEAGHIRIEPEDGLASVAPRHDSARKRDAAERTRHKKPYLPEKICPTCHRPFVWRKKWERDWANVVYCSKACHP